jgi:hypothetical protein
VQCVEKREKNALGPFLVCRVLSGQFGDCCSNCKWFDGASGCGLYTGPTPNRKRKKAGSPKGAEEDENVVADLDRDTGLGDLGADAVDPTLVSSEMFLAELAAAAVADDGLEGGNSALLGDEALPDTGTA